MKDFIQNQGENQENLKISFGVFRNAPQRTSVDFVWELPPALSSPEVKLVKENNLANGISPNKINTLLAYGLSSQSCLNFSPLSAGTVF